MANFIITPQFGNIKDSKKLEFNITGLEYYDGVRIKIENATNSTICSINNSKNYLYINDNVNNIKNVINLNIPEYSSHKNISIFANIEERKEDGSYELVKICPTSFYINEEKNKNFDGEIFVEPMFVDENNFCAIKVKSNSKSKIIISINDKKFNISTNDDGIGSISFKGKDILDVSNNVVNKFSIFYHDSEEKYFSGSHVYVLPSSIKTHVDPRCEDPNFVFEVPEECLDEIEPPIIIEEEEEVIAPDEAVPPTGFPISTENCNDIPILNSSEQNEICRINKTDTTLLANGIVLNAIVSVDKTFNSNKNIYFNKNRIFLFQNSTSLNVRVIAYENVIVPSKKYNEILQIFVEKDIWDRAENFSTNSLFVVLFNEIFAYTTFKVIGRGVDEYSGFYYLSLSNEDGSLAVINVDEWLSCQLAVFFEKLLDINSNFTYPVLNIDLVKKLPFISDKDDNIINVTNVSICSNIQNIEDNNTYYVYIIAEAIVENISQLFFYSFVVGEELYDVGTYGWKQLTFDGNNKNPKSHIDKDNNLHVFWESDRSGLTQIYYSILGPSSSSIGNAIISTIVDKEAQLRYEQNKPFDYTSQSILLLQQSEYYSPIDIITNSFVRNETGSGSVSITRNENVVISGNTIEDTAMAFTSMNSTTGFDISQGIFSQLNYQIEFDFEGVISQDTVLDGNSFTIPLDNTDIDTLFKEWKEKFTTTIEADFSNTATYIYNNNKFVIGRQDNVYDRLVPLVGSYKNEEVVGKSSGSIITTDFELVFAGDTKNIRHFMIGIMPEKVRFKATNSQSLVEYSDDNNESLVDNTYIAEEENIIYTGKYKFVVLFNPDNNYYGSPDKGYFEIIRKLPGIFNLDDSNNIKILINYSKLKCEEKIDISGSHIDPNQVLNSSLFFCSLTLFVNNSVEFSESFIVDLSDKYRKFDIGFGFPSKGMFLSDELFPYETCIYNDTDVVFNYNNILISSPTYIFNDEIIRVPLYMRSISDLIFDYNSADLGREDSCTKFFDTTSLLSLGLDADIKLNPSFPSDTTDNVDDNLFLQAPITLEGINKSVNFDIGLCNDLHLVWESNRNKYWNIFYSNSLNRNLPLRIETKITDTNSNSLMPDISINRNGKRMIVWHDDRNNNYEIYSARSLEGYMCNCGDNQEVLLMGEIEGDQSVISFNYKAEEKGTNTYNFKINFYTNSDYTNLYKSISSEDSIDGWEYDGASFESGGIELTEGTTVVISYTPNKDDGIFDKILYIQLEKIG